MNTFWWAVLFCGVAVFEFILILLLISENADLREKAPNNSEEAEQ